MNSPNLEPQSVGQILDRAIRIVRSNFVELAKSVLVVTVPLQILVFLLQISLVNEIEDPNSVDGADVARFIAFIVTVGIGTLLTTQLATAATIKINSETVLDRDSTSKDSLSFAVNRLGSLVFLAILSTVITIFGFFACVLPGIYLGVMWSVAQPVLLLEGKKGMNALRRSQELVRGRGWATLVAVVSANILAAIVGGILTIPIQLILRFMPDSQTGEAFVSAVSGIFTSAITIPFTAAIVVLIYFDLRVRKEAFDLNALASSLDPDDPGSASPIA